MHPRILVITATLGTRTSLARTIASVQNIGGKDVKHVIVCPEKSIPTVREKYANIECLAERPDKKGIYAALNHGFHTYGHNYDYLTFINDDDYWLPNYRKIIDMMLTNTELDMVYARTCYVNEQFIPIGEQTGSPQLKDFLPLLKKRIILLTQQATLIKSSLYFRIGGFDESYKLAADTKFWAEISLLNDLKFKYLNKICAAYMIQPGQLSSDHDTQETEHKRILVELTAPQKNRLIASLRFRLNNLPIYIKRIFVQKGALHNPFLQGAQHNNTPMEK